jgi:bifunctional UDP-N-acetylglucosamine pyrophosphorylase/glucosamine-1-phosphate N-acetyltransferase
MADLIKKTLGENMNYVTQVNQLGTAHAVQAACPSLQEDADCVVVLYGDQPLVDQIMVDRLVQEHEGSHGPVTMASVQVSDFDSWRSAFEFYGRIIRNEDQSITKIVEYKDANDAEKQVTEVNPAYFVFNKDWLCQNLSQIQTSNAQNEFYLTDLVQLAFKQGHNITAVPIDPQKGLGANTAEQLKVLESIVIK